MKVKKRQKNIAETRFAACAGRARLLSILPGAAGHVPASKNVSLVCLSAGAISRPAPRKTNKFNAPQNFSRENSARQTQNQNTPRNPDASAPPNL